MSVETIFRLFNEVGIINQLSTAVFHAKMPLGLHVSHFSVLNHFVRLGDGKTPLELARAFQVTKGTMTNTITVLSKNGFVRLEPHESDRRSKRVYITDKGRTFREEAIAALAPAIAQLSDKLDVAEIAAMLPALEKVRKALDEDRDSAP